MAKKIGTGDVSLRLAQIVSQQAKSALENGSFFEKATTVTQDLIRYWFFEPHTDMRDINFHEGQKQSILNTIYLHEVLGLKTVWEVYLQLAPELLTELDAHELTKSKYQIPKYAVKMATGTGKTWVMHALLIWQVLNAKHEEETSGLFTKNFLLVAPGLIVYDRLLDAYCGRLKEGENNVRDIRQNDFYKFQELFIPTVYRDEVFSFIANNVVPKDEIGRKATGGGMIVISNWHVFLGADNLEAVENEVEFEVSPFDETDAIINDILPTRPGTSAGNSLEVLDRQYLRGSELDFLAELPDLMVINDEAHHIHETKSFGEVEEVEWQKGLNRVSANKGSRFIQLDFSATPYDVSGSERNRTKHYFPHIISDFDLKTAIGKGLVKAITIDQRKEITDLPLEFRAIRDGNKVIALSDGQKLMLRAGLRKLQILEQEFVKVDNKKHPKMLVVCEDTNVSPYVVSFLQDEGLNENEIVKIDSNTKGELKDSDWRVVKEKLFNVDNYANPKVIVSVLMLREGFDVNNICVIVPLRSSQAQILLEQTIGRGLRLMWRGGVYDDMRRENIRRLLLEKLQPSSSLDILTIIEHPAFIGFYEDLLNEGLASISSDEIDSGKVLGDLIKVGLKENYQDYDLFFPVVMKDADEEILPTDINISQLGTFQLFPLSVLQSFIATDGEVFVSKEITKGTIFGEYDVKANLFSAASYNEYLQKLLFAISTRMERVTQRTNKPMPLMQINGSQIVGLLDNYIRTRLFGEAFNPFENNNWKILMVQNGIATEHIIKEMNVAMLRMQENVNITDAIVEKLWFSSISELKMREKFSLDLQKTIYEKLAFPSNKGLFERDFMEFLDTDSKVERFIKINETQHYFAKIFYIRTDGLLSAYHPDFMVVTAENIFIVETKGADKVHDENVKQKQLATVEWCKKINTLHIEYRMKRTWEYVLLADNHFYGLRDNGATVIDMCKLAKVSIARPQNKLFE